MRGCRACDAAIEPFIDFGRMPLANGFLSADEFTDEFFFNLSAAFCPRCTLVQLVEQPDPRRMFNDRYPFYSATSVRMQEHFAELASALLTSLPAAGAFVVEIGSNDGTLLRHVARAGVRHLGIEPAASVAQAAIAAGVDTMPAFFDATIARRVLSAHGPAHAIVAANALSHIADLHAVVEGIALLLAPDGLCVIEDPYWGDVVENTAFDQIYDEHASYFSLSSISQLFEAHGLSVVDVAHAGVHGGSMRYVIRRSGEPQTRAATELLERERSSELHQRRTFEAFRERVVAAGESLMTLLRGHHAAGRRVVGYGATSKSTTTINYFGITPDLLEFISDTTPAKQGLFSPGRHIPVRPHADFAADYPERALLFLWNHAAEVRAKEEAFARSGGRWIVYVPAVREW